MTIHNELRFCPHCKSNRLGKSDGSGPYVCAVCGCAETDVPTSLSVHRIIKRRYKVVARAGKPIKARGSYRRGGIITP